MLTETKRTDLFCEYYAKWITVYKKGAIRKVTMDKYLMTQKWLVIKRTADTSQMAAEIKTLFIRNHIYLHTDSEKDVQVLRERFLEWKNRNACKLNGKY